MQLNVNKFLSTFCLEFHYNGCAPIPFNVPNAQQGFQYAHTGLGMVGILTWYNTSWVPNGREIIGAQLTNTLQIGQKYFVSFFVNSSNNSPYRHVSNNKIGARFSTVKSNTTVIAPINNFAHVKTNVIYQDTLNWFKITGSFVADSSYKYINVGNFYDDLNTDTISYGPSNMQTAWSYYYIDDICVSTDSLYSANWTGFNENFLSTKTNIYPNPTSDFIYIDMLNKSSIDKLILYNKCGQELIVKANLFADKIDISNIADGIYFIQIISDGKTYFDKIIVRH